LYDLGVSRVLNAHITRPARSHFKTFNENGEFKAKLKTIYLQMNVIKNVKFEAIFDLGKNVVRLEYIPTSNLSHTSVIPYVLKFVVVELMILNEITMIFLFSPQASKG